MFYAKIPRFIEDDSIRLRSLRIVDGPFLMDGLRDEDILLANGLSDPISSSWVFVWWWIKKTFMPAYCIECDAKRIGFVGLYNLKLGKSAEMALLIFDKHNRRLGYGRRAFNILAQNLRRYSIVERVIVSIKKDNSISISFCRKLGFKELYATNGVKIMFIDFGADHQTGSDMEKVSREVISSKI
ncbi:MAG TPA: N-acetyltransferase [Proteobacteria bacterium]|nr:N-acetyltransferase [Pseudomonadota bacterium]